MFLAHALYILMISGLQAQNTVAVYCKLLRIQKPDFAVAAISNQQYQLILFDEPRTL